MPNSCCDKPAPPAPSDGTGPRVSIGRRVIGPGCPAYIIAEAGVNHDGSPERALQLVDAAAAVGADAVKFQVFCARELTTRTAGMADYQKVTGARSQRQMLERLELSDAALERISARCRKRAIEFLATPFSVVDLERLLFFGVRALKIASTDLNNSPLLRAAVEAGLPLICSTGAATAAEIRTAVKRLRAWGAGSRLVLLHCVSSYPTPLQAANLRAITALRTEFDVPAGFSDHTSETQTGAWAVSAGACVLEKHFTLDRSASGPDHAMSLTPAALADYIAAVRSAESALGTGTLGMTDLEADVRAVARKSVVTARALRAGTILTPDMLAVKRPAGGIEPDQLQRLIGRKVTANIGRDKLLTWDVIQ
jgi:N,N'-diacetyllegionaminate synthase